MKKILRMLGIVLLLSLTACSKSVETQVAEQLELAQRYLAEMKYDEAIVAFNKIIEIDEKNVDAYLGLAQVYVAQAEVAFEAQDYELAEKLYGLAEEMLQMVQSILPEHEEAKERLKKVREERESAVKVAEEEKNAKLFDEKLETLIADEGLFEARQKATVTSMEDIWFNHKGIFSANVMDFDSDGEEEMLVFHTEPLEDGETQRLMMTMYEKPNGEVIEVDSIPFQAFHEDERLREEWTFIRNQFLEDWLEVNVINKDGRNLIVCEGERAGGAFADGAYKAFWIMEYVDNHLQYVGSFSQDGVASDGAEFTGYTFYDGEISEADVFYSEWGNAEAIFDNWNEAVTTFFRVFELEAVPDNIGKHGVSLLNDNGQTKLFEFSNDVINVNYSGADVTAEIEVLLDSEVVAGQILNTVESDLAKYLDVANRNDILGGWGRLLKYGRVSVSRREGKLIDHGDYYEVTNQSITVPIYYEWEDIQALEPGDVVEFRFWNGLQELEIADVILEKGQEYRLIETTDGLQFTFEDAFHIGKYVMVWLNNGIRNGYNGYDDYPSTANAIDCHYEIVYSGSLYLSSDCKVKIFDQSYSPMEVFTRNENIDFSGGISGDIEKIDEDGLILLIDQDTAG